MSDSIRIATRSTPLALIQTELVAEMLRAQGLTVRRIELRTLGDRSLGGNLTVRRGMFTGELDAALLDGRADLAVHSLKDLPVELDSRLEIVAIPGRASPCDLLIQRQAFAPEAWPSLAELLEGSGDPGSQNEDGSAGSVDEAFSSLPAGAVVGTSSPRRQAGALAARPDLVLCAVRGSVGRRLEWLESGAVDALLLAEAGLERLASKEQYRSRYTDLAALRLAPHVWPPAPGQGALAIVASVEHGWRDHQKIRALVDLPTTDAVSWERALLAELGGGCSLPFAAFRDPSTWSAGLAGDDWRQVALSAVAPRVARVERLEDLDLARAARRLRDLLVIDPEASQTSDVGPPELLVTSSPESAARLTAELEGRLGRPARVVDLAVTRTRVHEVEWPVERARTLRHQASGRRTWPWVLVSSPNAGRILVERSRVETEWSSLPWCALGAGTARALLGLASPPNLVASSRDADEFAAFAGQQLAGVAGLFLPQSELADARLESKLIELGFNVTAFPAYTQVADAPAEWPREWRGVPERILFTSPSAVRAISDAGLPLPSVRWAMGRSTAEAMEHNGIEVTGVAERPTARGIAELWTPESRE